MSCASNNIIEKRKTFSIFFWIIFFIFIGMSAFVIYKGYILINLNNDKIDRGLGFISIGLGLLSVGGIIYSFKNSFDNNTKFIRDENAKFQRILQDFEQERIYYIRGEYNIEAYIWRSRTQLERANEIDKKLIKCQHHYRLIQYFIVTLNVLFNRQAYNNLTQGQQSNIKNMYRIVREFDRSSERQENNFSNILLRMGKNSEETEEQFYNRLFNQNN